MYKLPKKSRGDTLTAAAWNDHVDAINDALCRASNFNAMVPSVPAPPRWGGGRYAHDAGGFSLRSLTRSGTGWEAFFNPGRVLEVHAGGTRIIIPKIGGKMMDAIPYQPLKAEAGKKVYLDLTMGDNSHDCITAATISTNETYPGGRSVRLTLGKFVSASGSSGSSIDDITYDSFLSGVITYAQGSRNDGWRVLAAADKDGQPKAAYVLRGNIYSAGRLVSEGTGGWVAAPVAKGDIWLNVQCDGDGGFKSYSLAGARGEAVPLNADGLAADGTKQLAASYSFKLATISAYPEPLKDHGNPASFVNVRQYILGSVFCGLKAVERKKDECGNEGFRVRVVKDAGGNVTAVQVRPGHVYFKGRFLTTALDGVVDGWVTHSATSGEVWLVVDFDVWGVFQSAHLATMQPSTATLTPFMLSTHATGIKGQYAFHLATVAAGGDVTQWTLGAVYCLFDPGTFFPPGPAD